MSARLGCQSQTKSSVGGGKQSGGERKSPSLPERVQFSAKQEEKEAEEEEEEEESEAASWLLINDIITAQFLRKNKDSKLFLRLGVQKVNAGL